MSRKQELTRKVKSKPSETEVKRLRKSCNTSSSTSSITPELDNTLPDDIFLDSFDKFRFIEEQELRANKVLKKDVRVSFNLDSSIENSSHETDTSYSYAVSVSSHSEHEAEKGANEESDSIDEENVSMPNTPIAGIMCDDASQNDSVGQFHQEELLSTEAHMDVEPITMTLSSSSSCDQIPIHKTIVTSSTPMSVAVRSKLSVKPKVVFDVEDSVHELSEVSLNNDSSHRIQLKGGKWRRTIFEIRKNKVTQSPRRTIDIVNSAQQFNGVTLRRKSIYIKDIRDRRTINYFGKGSHHNFTVSDKSDISVVESPRPNYVNVRPRYQRIRLPPIMDNSDESNETNKSNESSKSNETDKSTYFATSPVALSSSSCVESSVDEISSKFDLDLDKDQLKAQLLKRCRQIDVLPFDEIYSASVLKKCRKIGEGVFGEVFLNETSSGSSYVMKIIPIGSNKEINGAEQKRFDEILQEVIISQELSALRHGIENNSSGFVEVLNVRFIEGRYPDHLLEMWNEYDTLRQSENDCPDMFTDDQLYVVFELANGGTDLEAHHFKNAEQSFSAFKQVALSLAVAESEFQFEHRDLHWGNVLVKETTETMLAFNLNGEEIKVRTYGIKATIIDYTLSRLVYKDCCLFQDLATDPELFEANGDYQFDIYRLMKVHTSNVWEVFEPFTNVLWLHYTIDKMINGVHYTASKSVKHRQTISQMMRVRDGLLERTSCTDYIETDLQQ